MLKYAIYEEVMKRISGNSDVKLATNFVPDEIYNKFQLKVNLIYKETILQQMGGAITKNKIPDNLKQFYSARINSQNKIRFKRLISFQNDQSGCDRSVDNVIININNTDFICIPIPNQSVLFSSIIHPATASLLGINSYRVENDYIILNTQIPQNTLVKYSIVGFDMAMYVDNEQINLSEELVEKGINLLVGEMVSMPNSPTGLGLAFEENLKQNRK